MIKCYAEFGHTAGWASLPSLRWASSTRVPSRTANEPAPGKAIADCGVLFTKRFQSRDFDCDQQVCQLAIRALKRAWVLLFWSESFSFAQTSRRGGTGELTGLASPRTSHCGFRNRLESKAATRTAVGASLIYACSERDTRGCKLQRSKHRVQLCQAPKPGTQGPTWKHYSKSPQSYRSDHASNTRFPFSLDTAPDTDGCALPSTEVRPVMEGHSGLWALLCTAIYLSCQVVVNIHATDLRFLRFAPC